MNHVKDFTSFMINESNKFRMPEQVSIEEFDKKLRNYKILYFSKEEVEFFNKFIKKNDGKVKYLQNIPTMDFDIFNFYGIFSSRIQIMKLEDDWYLIKNYTESSVKRYICDEWEEVLGYLTKCNFNI